MWAEEKRGGRKQEEETSYSPQIWKWIYSCARIRTATNRWGNSLCGAAFTRVYARANTAVPQSGEPFPTPPSPERKVCDHLSYPVPKPPHRVGSPGPHLGAAPGQERRRRRHTRAGRHREAGLQFPAEEGELGRSVPSDPTSGERAMFHAPPARR